MNTTERATVTSKGQITIPKEIRERLELTRGETVSFELTDEGEVVIRKAGDPLAQLRDLREEIAFTESEIEAMKRDSKRRWSKYG